MIELMKDAAILDTLSIGEKLIGALTVTLLGMGVTFFILLILMGSINIMMKAMDKKKESIVTDTPIPKPKLEISKVDIATNDEEDEIVAAIIAAITLIQGNSAFRVKNIVPSYQSKNWALTGRLEAINRAKKN